MDRPGLVAATGVAALALALAGCTGGEPRPKIAPSDSSSAAGTPTPTPTRPTEPALPPEARQPTKAGAEAFVRHYWAVVNYAQATGETTALAALATAECGGCHGGLESIRETYNAGGRMEGGEIVISSLRSARLDLDTLAFSVIVSAQVTPQVVRVPGKDPQRFEGGPVKLRTIIEQRSNGWLVARSESVE